MKNNPKISIVVPVYNLEKDLSRCVASISAQTYQNLEILLVDDGSTDQSRSVISQLEQEDARIVAIYKDNGGVTSARLKGLSKATGKYIGFVDGDDLIEPQMYQRLLENAEKLNADISHCGYQMVFPDGHIDYYYNTGKIVFQKGHQGCSDLLEGKFVEPGLWNKLYRRELFSGLDTWMDRNICINEDLLMNFYLFRQSNITVFEDVCPYHYVLRKESATKSRLNMHQLRDPLSVLHILHKETSDTPEWNSIVERRLIHQLINSATMELKNETELITPFRRETRRELRQRLFVALRGSACSRKLKAMALWAAAWPASYGFVHRVYAKATGIDKKYRIE